MEPFILAGSYYYQWTTTEGILFGFPLNRDGSSTYHLRYSDLVQGAAYAGEHNVTHEKAVAECVPVYDTGLEKISPSFTWERSQPSQQWYFGQCTGHGFVTMNRNRYEARGVYTNVDDPDVWGEFMTFYDYTPAITSPGSYAYITETWWRTYDQPVWRQTGEGRGRERFSKDDLRYCSPAPKSYPFADMIREMVINEPAIPAGIITSLYSDAVSAIRLESNQIANVLEVASLIGDTAKVLAHGPTSFFKKVLDNLRSKGSKNAASLWLAYRYQYNTTKSDVEDVVEKLNSAAFDQGEELILRSGTRYNKTRLNLKVVLQSVYSNKFAEQHKQLMKYGGALTPYNIWDMVPFSFVVDWFLPIGDNLALSDLNYYFRSAAYKVIYTELSHKVEDKIIIDSDTINLSAYLRDIGTRVPTFTVYEESPSTKTVVKRCLDAGSLILG